MNCPLEPVKNKRKEFEVIRIEKLWGRTLPICFWLLCRAWSCSGVARRSWRLELAAALGWKAGATLTRTLSKKREGNPFSSKAYCLLSSSCLQSSLLSFLLTEWSRKPPDRSIWKMLSQRAECKEKNLELRYSGLIHGINGDRVLFGGASKHITRIHPLQPTHFC